MRTAPFMGKGIAFPFRVNPVTGGVLSTVGGYDNVSVALQYLNERWTIREDVHTEANHIAECIAHILLTRLTEHDTLPEFGSRLFEMLFEPNTTEFELLASHWMQTSTVRWEKRARIPEGGTAWQFLGHLADEGIAPCLAYIEFIMQQAEGNLVAPFVTTRQARLQEYQTATVDNSGHDYESRYYGTEQVRDLDGIWFNRLYAPRIYPPAQLDEFYQVVHGDTWLLISWKVYGDIRYWPVIAEMYVEDMADNGEGSRDDMDTCGDPPPGTILRLPSRSRMLMESVA